MVEVFDYEIIGSCQYEIDGGYCGEPVTHKVWWSDDESDAMLVCPEHFRLIEKAEAQGD